MRGCSVKFWFHGDLSGLFGVVGSVAGLFVAPWLVLALIDLFNFGY